MSCSVNSFVDFASAVALWASAPVVNPDNKNIDEKSAAFLTPDREMKKQDIESTLSQSEGDVT
jgi:hypothetical protein